MIEIRVQFSRGREVMYISHLDLMRTFERAMRRANLPLSYSEGFNPHPHMVFGLPLPVGVTSEAEYADFTFDREIDPSELQERLNHSLPEGIKIIRAAVKTSKSNIMASIISASYHIEVFASEGLAIIDIESKIREYLRQEKILINKATKSGMKLTDIKPLVRNISFIGTSSRSDGKGISYAFDADLSAGSAANLRPELLISSLAGFAGIMPDYCSIHRKALFTGKDGQLTDPMDAAAI